METRSTTRDEPEIERDKSILVVRLLQEHAVWLLVVWRRSVYCNSWHTLQVFVELEGLILMRRSCGAVPKTYEQVDIRWSLTGGGSAVTSQYLRSIASDPNIHDITHRLGNTRNCQRKMCRRQYSPLKK